MSRLMSHVAHVTRFKICCIRLNRFRTMENENENNGGEDDMLDTLVDALASCRCTSTQLIDEVHASQRASRGTYHSWCQRPSIVKQTRRIAQLCDDLVDVLVLRIADCW